MNLLEFTVTAILDEKHDLAYKLYGMTEKQAKEERNTFWRNILFQPAIKQTYEYDCCGVKSTHTRVFLANESPYYVGYKGVRITVFCQL